MDAHVLECFLRCSGWSRTVRSDFGMMVLLIRTAVVQLCTRKAVFSSVLHVMCMRFVRLLFGSRGACQKTTVLMFLLHRTEAPQPSGNSAIARECYYPYVYPSTRVVQLPPPVP